jgi:TPR repeat protein
MAKRDITQKPIKNFPFTILLWIVPVVFFLFGSDQGSRLDRLGTLGVNKEGKAIYSNGLLENAKTGIVSAQVKLAGCYAEGRGVRVNRREAAKWYRVAADRGNVTAQCHLGRCYEKGWGVRKSELEAVQWYRKAAAQGDSYGEFLLGVAYECGVGVKRDYNQAVELYQKSADRGSVYGQCFLGSCYEEGFGVEKNENIAKLWYAAARNNDPKQTAEILRRLRICRNDRIN